MRGDHHKRPGGQSGTSPSLARRRFVDFECAKMVPTESLAGRPAGAEGLDGFLRGKTAQVGVLERVLRDTGNSAPISDPVADTQTMAIGAVRRIVTKVMKVQLGQDFIERAGGGVPDPRQKHGLERDRRHGGQFAMT